MAKSGFNGYNRGHQVHSFPAGKFIPKSTIRKTNRIGRQVLKKTHTKKTRNYSAKIISDLKGEA